MKLKRLAPAAVLLLFPGFVGAMLLLRNYPLLEWEQLLERAGRQMNGEEAQRQADHLRPRGVTVGNLDGVLGVLATLRPYWIGCISHLTGLPMPGIITRLDLHLWSTSVLAVPLERDVVETDKEKISQKWQHPRLGVIAGLPLEAAQQTPGATWFTK